VSIGLGVSGIEQVMSDLEARGVRFAPPGLIETGVERLANFRDPDQTPLYLFELAQH
jgi:catechol 2,3-dioxygenase-like lactoylglutathione lyase family enzyme